MKTEAMSSKCILMFDDDVRSHTSNAEGERQVKPIGGDQMRRYDWPL
jgi:hypothetical protein